MTELQQAYELKKQREQEDLLIAKIPALEQEIADRQSKQAEIAAQSKTIYFEVLRRYLAGNEELCQDIDKLRPIFGRIAISANKARRLHGELLNSSVQMVRLNNNGDDWNTQGLAQQHLINADVWPVTNYKSSKPFTPEDHALMTFLAEYLGINSNA